MKLIKLFTVAVCAFSLVAGSTLRADDKEVTEKKTCCEKAKAAGKDCSHKCCVEAKKDGKTCEKCNPKKSPKSEESKESK